MRLAGNWLLVYSLVTTILYQLLRLVFITVQRIYWQLNGTAQKLREARLPHNYERSAQVLDIVLYHKFCRLLTPALSNFLCTHNHFENPQYIIDNDNITIMCFDEHVAVFCEAKEKGMHLWRGDYDSFIRDAQMNYGKRLIVVPLTTFHRMAEVIGDPQGELIFVFITTRCGSTLLTQVNHLRSVDKALIILESTGRCVAVSEPNSPTLVSTKYRKFGDSSELRQLARDVIRWECRPYPTMQPSLLGYLLKLNSSCIVALPMFRDLYPSSRCLFMYRDVVTVAKSLYRTSMVHVSLHVVRLLGQISGTMTKIVIDSMGFDGSYFRVRLDNDLMFGALLYTLTTATYLDLRRRGFDVSALCYEDLVARPLDMCRVVLEFCHLPVSLAELAVKAFDVDAQRNSVLAKSVIGHFKEPELTPRIKNKLNEVLKKFGLPLIGEPFILEGTISC